MTRPEVNRTITDLRARLRLGGDVAAEAVQLAADTLKGQDGDLGRTAKALGVSRRTLERARQDFPVLATALDAVLSAQAVLGP